MATDATVNGDFKRRRGLLLVLLVCVAAFGVLAAPFVHRLYYPAVAERPEPPATRPATTQSVRTIVFIVPGTYGNEGFWPNIIPGKATFASELRRGLGDDATIYPCLWYAANDHQNREAAARQVAAVIDEKANEGFDRIFVVGHSHGGNVALWATGLAHHKVDAVVCLATPHVYLSAKGTDGKPVELPVYCTAQTRKNAGKIVAACADSDSVPDLWADAANGVDDNVAIAMTRGWQEQLNHPRLGEDNWWAHTFGDSNVTVKRELTAADANVTIRSFVSDRLGVTPHYAAHSRRMGYVVGSLLHEACSDSAVDYVRTLVQPADADAGGPVDEAEQMAWVKRNEAQFGVAGWRLDHASIQLDPTASQAARNLAGSTPEPYLRIRRAADRKIVYEGKSDGRTFSLSWDSNFILWKGPEYYLGVYAQHNLKRDSSLGDRALRAEQVPPSVTGKDVSNGIYWSGDFAWTAVHY